MTISVHDLVGPILAAVKPILAKHWEDVSAYAEGEATKMAQTLATIASLKAAGKIDEKQAAVLIDMQKHAMQAVLCAVEGIGLIAAQNAINAALDAVAGIVNKGIGFALL
jgi:hypothetical protein